jgi:uncharacterized protein (TIGR00645 family)
MAVGAVLLRAGHQLAGAFAEVSAHHAWGASESDIILGVLSLIDVTLTANLVVIAVFSGYENFVSRIDLSGHSDWPVWYDAHRFLRAQTESPGFDCRYFGGPGAEGLYES